MKRIFLLVAALMLMLSSTAFADKGAITFIGRQSRHIVIVTDYNSYSCGTITIMSPTWQLNKGDYIEGNFNGYGEQQFYDHTSDVAFSIWIDTFYIDAPTAFEWIQDNS